MPLIRQEIRMMKRPAFACMLIALMVIGWCSAVEAAVVNTSEEWGMTLEAGESFTCIAHYIPDIPEASDSLMFSALPEWTDTWYFDFEAEGWQTEWSSEDPTIAYLYGPRLTNDTLYDIDLFSFNLFYQWDDAEELDPNGPVYQDVVIFDGQEITKAYGISGDPDGLWNSPKLSGPYYEEEPYVNPVPEPMTICLLGLGVAFLRKKR
jgi:hypothetical protein